MQMKNSSLWDGAGCPGPFSPVSRTSLLNPSRSVGHLNSRYND